MLSKELSKCRKRSLWKISKISFLRKFFTKFEKDKNLSFFYKKVNFFGKAIMTQSFVSQFVQTYLKELKSLSAWPVILFMELVILIFRSKSAINNSIINHFYHILKIADQRVPSEVQTPELSFVFVLNSVPQIVRHLPARFSWKVSNMKQVRL